MESALFVTGFQLVLRALAICILQNTIVKHFKFKDT